ncbi:hypothetical protein SBDP1_510012 [Syntrophobacter sp. SbD1]|nr:hypothetical protein SBDP1_510012 [Syntrophobacter sp. SbD1]
MQSDGVLEFLFILLGVLPMFN